MLLSLFVQLGIDFGLASLVKGKKKMYITKIWSIVNKIDMVPAFLYLQFKGGEHWNSGPYTQSQS